LICSHAFELIQRISIDSAEDEEAGEIPVAFVVRKSGSGLSCTQVMEYVSKQVKKVEKVYINPSPMGVGLHNPQTMKWSISPPEFSKTGQITLENSFEKS